MAHGFGHLYKGAKGVITFQLSPFRQKAVGSFFTTGVVSGIKYAAQELPPMLPAMISGAFLFKWASDNFAQNLRKNPADYVNDA
eukprot:m.135248 g.135248  ORF g.135248 m.135248 type:complete len:84 (+) comp9878_c0_seq1:55-306(+)